VSFDLPSGSKLFHILFFLAFISLLSIFQKYFTHILFLVFSKIQLSIFSIIFLFFVFETIYFFNPNLFPNLNLWINKENNAISTVEYLDSNPFIKFKSNTTVRSRFFRGSVDQFHYSWETDLRGFKNHKSIANLSKFDVVAIGDSWTEGMGVSIDDTFPSILSSSGFLTYNLGVQGYSPSQMRGSLEAYGIDLKPKFIIATYTMNTYTRENFLKNKKDNQKKTYTGGIGDIEEAQINPEIRNQAKYIFSAIWLMSKNVRKIVINKFKYSSVSFLDKKFEPYKQITTISDYNSTPKDLLSWESTLNEFKKINSISKRIGAKLILVYGPKRPVIYYERATRKKVPENVFNESDLLKKFSKENGIIYIDPSEKLISYVNNLPKNFKIKSLPFLEIDGHMNRIGYTIFANEIINELN